MNSLRYKIGVVVEEQSSSFSDYFQDSFTYTISPSAPQTIQFPLALFETPLSPFRLLVRYLIDINNLSVRETATLLHRSYASIWLTYRNSKKIALQHSNSSIVVDLSSLFENPSLTFFESLVVLLKQRHNFSQIGRLLKRNPRTIWTTYKKALKKMGEIHA